jgi:hypothetical protein
MRLLAPKCFDRPFHVKLRCIESYYSLPLESSEAAVEGLQVTSVYE